LQILRPNARARASARDDGAAIQGEEVPHLKAVEDAEIVLVDTADILHLGRANRRQGENGGVDGTRALPRFLGRMTMSSPTDISASPAPPNGIELVLVSRAHDMGGFEVRRAWHRQAARPSNKAHERQTLAALLAKAQGLKEV
jgi:hypothetical protein